MHNLVSWTIFFNNCRNPFHEFFCFCAQLAACGMHGMKRPLISQGDRYVFRMSANWSKTVHYILIFYAWFRCCFVYWQLCNITGFCARGEYGNFHPDFMKIIFPFSIQNSAIPTNFKINSKETDINTTFCRPPIFHFWFNQIQVPRWIATELAFMRTLTCSQLGFRFSPFWRARTSYVFIFPKWNYLLVSVARSTFTQQSMSRVRKLERTKRKVTMNKVCGVRIHCWCFIFLSTQVLQPAYYICGKLQYCTFTSRKRPTRVHSAQYIQLVLLLLAIWYETDVLWDAMLSDRERNEQTSSCQRPLQRTRDGRKNVAERKLWI